MFCRAKAAHDIARSRAPGGSRYLFPPSSKTQRLCLSFQRFSLMGLLVRCLASLAIFKSFVAQLGRPTSLPEGKNSGQMADVPPNPSARNAHNSPIAVEPTVH